MKKISLTILALVAVLMLASCGKAKKVSIAGSWSADSGSETVYLLMKTELVKFQLEQQFQSRSHMKRTTTH